MLKRVSERGEFRPNDEVVTAFLANPAGSAVHREYMADLLLDIREQNAQIIEALRRLPYFKKES